MALDETTKKVVMVHDGTSTTLHSDLLKKDLPTTNNGVFLTQNRELAAEMESKYRGHVITANYPSRVAPRGRVEFAMPALPWTTLWQYSRWFNQFYRNWRSDHA